MRSLRTSLLWRTALLLVATFSVAAIALYLLMRSALLVEFDAALLVEARSLSSHVEQNGQDIILEFDIGHLPEYARAESPHYFQIWKSDHDSVARSDSLDTNDLDLPSHISASPTCHSVILPNAMSARQIELAFHPRREEVGDASGDDNTFQSQVLTLAVARDVTELDKTLATLTWFLCVVTGFTVIISIAMLSRIIKHELQPLNTLATVIERVGTADLSERIEVETAPQEMSPVVHRLNELLGRLGEVIAHEKSFTADVAHELRTPLAALQTALEVCGSRLRNPEDYLDVITKCLHITAGMRTMVNDLLLLARADAQQLTVMMEPVDVGTFVRECWLPFEDSANQRRLTVRWALPESTVVRLDREKTRLVLHNLFGNAVTYAAESGWVSVTAGSDGSRATVAVANDGCQLRQTDLAHLFDRFWRGDEARSDAGLHCGLGLSLCHKVVEILDGSITAQIENDVFAVTIALPTTMHKAL